MPKAITDKTKTIGHQTFYINLIKIWEGYQDKIGSWATFTFVILDLVKLDHLVRMSK